MLALTRRINEEVVIGDPDNPLGVIRVVSVHGDKVRLSFDFPRDVKINRRELADQKKNGGDTGGTPAKTNGNGGGSGGASASASTGGNGKDTNGKNGTNNPASNATNNAASPPANNDRQDNATASNDKDSNQGAA